MAVVVAVVVVVRAFVLRAGVRAGSVSGGGTAATIDSIGAGTSGTDAGSDVAGAGLTTPHSRSITACPSRAVSHGDLASAARVAGEY